MLKVLVFPYLFCRQNRGRGWLDMAMDFNSCVLMIAVCICANYGNKIKFLPKYNGLLDKVKEKYRYSDNIDFPQFSREHGNLERGNG